MHFCNYKESENLEIALKKSEELRNQMQVKLQELQKKSPEPEAQDRTTSDIQLDLKQKDEVISRLRLELEQKDESLSNQQKATSNLELELKQVSAFIQASHASSTQTKVSSQPCFGSKLKYQSFMLIIFIEARIILVNFNKNSCKLLITKQIEDLTVALKQSEQTKDQLQVEFDLAKLEIKVPL